MDGTCLARSPLNLVVHKDSIGVTERGEEFEQIGFGIDLGLFENAILERSFEDLLLSRPASPVFQGLGQACSIPPFGGHTHRIFRYQAWR